MSRTGAEIRARYVRGFIVFHTNIMLVSIDDLPGVVGVQTSVVNKLRLVALSAALDNIMLFWLCAFYTVTV